MSCHLAWKPIIQDSFSVGEIQLREILDKRYGYPSKLDCTDIPYLEALKDDNVDGAEELIEEIRKHEEIQIFLVC